MTSTVLDVAVCLLLVSAGVVTLVAADAPSDAADPAAERRAEAVVETLSTSTAGVHYSLASGARPARRVLGADAVPVASGPSFERYRRGTHASLLARAAMAGVAVDGRRLTRTGDGLRRAVENETTRSFSMTGAQVVAVWRPYAGAPVTARVGVGPTPPNDATVHAATTAVPSGVPSARTAATNAADGGYAAVADAVARAVVAGLFPPAEADLALDADYPVSALVRYRYRRAAALTGASLGDSLDDGDAARANDRLAAALSTRLERDVRARFDSPDAAARAVRTSRVDVVVRTWSS
jgi:hypothetical protein